MRSYNNQYSRAISYSYDGGETWSEIEHDYQLVEPRCQASILNFGKIDEQTMQLFLNPAIPIGRTHMTIKCSFDDCQSWSNSKLIYEGPSAYSCLTKLPNGKVGLFFEAGKVKAYEKMVFLSFEPGELFIAGSLLNDDSL